MGRKICVFMVGLILMGLAGEVRGQENLDTLWTRTIGGAGNDVNARGIRAGPARARLGQGWRQQ